MQNLVFTQLSIPELRKVIRDEQEAVLKDFLQTLNTTQADLQDEEQFINKREAAKLWNCSTSTIDNKAREGIITRYYIGKKSVRFKKSEILEVIEEMNKKRR